MQNFKITNLKLNDVLSLEPKVYEDERGFFYESFNTKSLKEIIKSDYNFVQDNHSFSNKNVLRGLHFQIEKPKGKLIREINGKIFDVFVDLRPSSSTFQKWDSIILSSKNRKQVWIPPGLAHGFCVLSKKAEVVYKTTDFWHQESEKTLMWNDKTIGIKWPDNISPIMSKKDLEGSNFEELLEILDN